MLALDLGTKLPRDYTTYCASRLSVVIPLMLLAHVYPNELDSWQDFLLETSKLYVLLCLGKAVTAFIDSVLVRHALHLAFFNALYDVVTEFGFIKGYVIAISPLADAVLDEAVLTLAYVMMIYGLFQHVYRIERRVFFDELTHIYSRRAMKRIPVGDYQLFYFDLDGFKALNDTYGHAYGDTILQEFALNLKKLCGLKGYAIRIGGDEFVAVIIRRDANRFIEQLNKFSEQSHIKFSYGSAPIVAQDFAQAMLHSDQALYQMKREKKCTEQYRAKRA